MQKVGAGKNAIEAGSNLDNAIGARVRLTLAPENKELEGNIYTTCSVMNAVAITTESSQPAQGGAKKCDYHVIPFAHITAFQILDATADSGTLPEVSEVDVGALRAREERTIRDMKLAEARQGKGVSKLGQDVFDWVAKMFPARWADARIIVNEAVIIDPPYGLENVKAAKNGEQSLQMVRNRVSRFYASSQQNQAGGAQAGRPQVATPIAPRKGG